MRFPPRPIALGHQALRFGSNLRGLLIQCTKLLGCAGDSEARPPHREAYRQTHGAQRAPGDFGLTPGAPGVVPDRLHLLPGANRIVLRKLDQRRGAAGRQRDLIVGQLFHRDERVGRGVGDVGHVDQHLKLSVIRPTAVDFLRRDSPFNGPRVDIQCRRRRGKRHPFVGHAGFSVSWSLLRVSDARPAELERIIGREC